MGRYDYGYDIAEPTRECVETFKDIKKRYEVSKRKLNDYYLFTKNMDIDYKAKHEALGSLYTDMRRHKEHYIQSKSRRKNAKK